MSRSTKQLSITLPKEMAEEVRAKVVSGAYASESEVIRDGLRALRARDHAVEDWLRGPIAAAYDAMKADRGRAVPIDKVRAKLAGEHKRASQRRPRK